jgi:hypothetical protein
VTSTYDWDAEQIANPPAHDLDAEERVLGALFFDLDALDAVAEVLVPGDFYRPAHEVTYRAMITMRAAGVQIDPLTVADWISREMGGDLAALGGAREAPGYLMRLYDSRRAVGGAPAAVGAAEIVAERALNRHAEENFNRCLQLLRSAGADTREIVARAAEELDAVMRHAAEADDPMAGQMTGRAFTTRHRVRMPALIPGLLHVLDRVVIVGGEGRGKSVLRDQFACAAAAGVHPFVPTTRFPPLRVLIIDLENPTDLLQDRLEAMMGLAAQWGEWDDDRLRVWSHPGGLDLRDPGDVHRLAANIRKARPDLVLAGPVKKMYHDRGETSDHAMVTEKWDALRMRHRFALMLEHHQPTGNVRRPDRPGGSGIWMSWPESGLLLKPAPKDAPKDALAVSAFRGHRRPGIIWPVELQRAPWGGQWPWQARYPQESLLDGEAR